MISGLVLKNNVSIHGTLNSKEIFVNYQAAGMWEGRGLKLFKEYPLEEGRLIHSMPKSV